MPITENNFTAEEFATALKENQALNDLVAGFLTDDASKDLPARQKLEGSFIGSFTSKQAQLIENDTKEIFGVEKLPNEKYYDYWKRAAQTKTGEYKKAFDELETLKKAGNPSEAQKTRIAQLEGLLQEEKGNFTKQLQEKEARIRDLSIGSEVKVGLAAIREKYRKDLPANVVSIVEKTAIDSLVASGELQEDGKLTFKDKEGKVLMNKSTYQPMTAEEVLADTLKDLIDTGKQQPGAGSGEGTQKKGPDVKTGEKGQWNGRPASVTSKEKLTSYLLDLGYVSGSDDWNKVWSENAKDLPLRD